MRGAHAALSPNFGAPATPAVWHAVHTLSKVFLPAPAAPFAAAPPAAGGGIAATATGAAGAAAAGGATGALGSIATFATGEMRSATRSGRIAASPLSERDP